MSNAAKYKKKAAELELQKQFDKAVAMYMRAIEAGDAEGAEVDVTVLNKVGDLTLRLGRVAEAVSSYERAVEHYTTVGLFNNAIALCNKILRNAPGRAGIYLTLGRVCAKKGMRGDATRNFLEYASRMQREGRTDEAMRSLGEVAGLMPELEEVRRLVEEHAERAGIALPAAAAPAEVTTDPEPRRDSLVFLDVDYDAPVASLPAPSASVPPLAAIPTDKASTVTPPAKDPRMASLDDLLIFDPLADDLPTAAPAPLDGLEATPTAVLEGDVPSLLAPSEAVEVDASLDAADGLTDALGFDAQTPPMLNAPVLDGLVSDTEDVLLPPEHVVEQAETDDALVDDDVVEAMPVRLETLTPYRGTESISPPSSEEALPPIDLITLTPYGGITAITPPSDEPPVELATLSPYDGIESLTPPSLPPIDLETAASTPVSIDELPETTDAHTRDAIDRAVDGLDLDVVDWDDAEAVPFAMIDDATAEPIAVEPMEIEALSSAMPSVDAPELDTSALDAAGLDEPMLDMSALDALVLDPPAPEPLVPVTPAAASPLVELPPLEPPARTSGAHDVVIADLLEHTPLPPPHSTRPARAIPRLDPHDFILPGELPPIVLPDEWLGLEAAEPTADAGAPVAELTAGLADTEAIIEAPTDEVPEWMAPGADLSRPLTGAFDAIEDIEELDAAFEPAAAASAFNLALDRCARLREEVEANPGDWARRRRLAEALLEAGERALGLDELSATALGLEVEGDLTTAVQILDELVRVAPEQVSYHQKRVELAVRLGDRDRLRESYLDLADALVRSGHAVRAEPVYVRVLELDPWDDRARAALGDAAPPPPSPKPSAAPADDGYVNLADWLADDASPRDTRMRVKEPTVTGDEDADFDSLLQNFREGVARSLGEDDYESHYDLGVAYKEMGLLDDAVAEFQRALRSPTHRLPAYEALGQCFLEQGSFPVAVTVLSRALHEPGLDDEQRVGVLYLLGYACEALQRRDEARSYYQRVYATDIHFRDVAERLTVLTGGTA